MSPSFSQIEPKTRKRIFRLAFVRSVPVLLGYVTLGIAAGVLLAVKGDVPFAPFWSSFCGVAFISGTLSFAIVPAMAGGFTLGQVALLTLGINFRYAFYGFSMLSRWRDVPFFQKWLLVHTLADEVYALAISCPLKDDLEHRYYCLWNGALCGSYWLIGTLVGGLAGSILPIPARGIEFTMVALYLAILTDQLREIVRHQRNKL